MALSFSVLPVGLHMSHYESQSESEANEAALLDMETDTPGPGTSGHPTTGASHARHLGCPSAL